MWNPFRNLFGGKSKTVVGLDIGSASIKIVELSKRRGHAVLESYGELALGPYAGAQIGQSTKLSPTKTSEAIADILSESKISVRECGLAIPFGVSLVSAIEMPVVPEQELARMVPLEAKKYIPVPLSEVTLDWWVVPAQNHQAVAGQKGQPAPVAQERLDVLLVAIQNDVLSRYQNILSRTGLVANFFEIELFSTLRSIAEPGDSPQMIIDIGASATKLYIVEGGIIRVSHVIHHGSEELTMALSKTLGLSIVQAEILKRDLSKAPMARKADIDTLIAANLEGPMTEASRVLAGYEKKYNRTVSQVILVGGGAALKGILPIARRSFSVDIVLGNPFGKVEVPAIMEESLKSSGPEFTVALGVALRRLQEIE